MHEDCHERACRQNDFETKDFEPDQIIKQVPELAKLLELREALKALKNPLSNVPDFRKKIQQLVTDPDQRAALMKELGLNEEEK